MDTKYEQFYALVILLCVVQIIIFGVVGSISKEVEIQYVNSSDRITQSFNIATLE